MPAKNAKRPQTGKKKPAKAPARSSGGRGGSRAAEQSHRQMRAVVIFFLALLLLLFAIIPGAKAWNAVHNFLLGLFGVCAYIWPVLVGYVAVESALDRPGARIGSRVVFSTIVILLLGGTLDVFCHYREAYGSHLLEAFTMGSRPSGGGLLGGLVGWPFRFCFDFTGAAILLILLLVVFVMLLTGTTIIQLLRALAKPARTIRESIVETSEGAYERRRQLEEQRLRSLGAVLESNDPERADSEEQAPPPREDLESKKKRLLRSYATRNGEPLGQEEASDEPAEEEQATEAAQPVREDEPPEIDEIIARLQSREQGNTADEEPAASVAVREEAPAPQKRTKPSGEDNTPIPMNIDATVSPAAEKTPYRHPPVSLLDPAKDGSKSEVRAEELKANGALLVDTLRSFGVETRIVDISRGPSVTRYELQPSAGVKISKITNLADDIALNLATQGVRIEAPIPNKAAVGIEVPNKKVDVVHIREVVDTPQFREAKSPLTVALGKDIAGDVALADLAKMPHLLIAGSTGSGKSVCINSMLVSLLYKSDPDEVRLLMVDPKVVELGVYNGIPHLLVPVVTDPRKAAGALGWAVTEMMERYKLFGECNVRKLEEYNRFAETHEGYEKRPRIVIVIDELADLMMVAPNEVEDSICRLAQLARAAGMHLVIATQRPSVDVITGVIKTNIPSRIAFAVANQFDSRTILDSGGAEKLLGRGDMLYSPMGSSKPTRIQGCFVTDREIEAILAFVKEQSSTEYSDTVMEGIEQHIVPEKGAKKGGRSSDEEEGGGDEMLPQAIEAVVEAGFASVTLLQKRLKLGYARASRIMDELEENGIVGPFEGSKPRKVLITKQQWMERQNQTAE